EIVQSHSYSNKECSQNVNRHVAPAIADGIFAGAKEHEQRLSENFKANNKQDGKDNGKGHAVSKDLLSTVIVLLTHADRCSGRAAHADQCGKCGYDGDNRKCDAYAGEC